MLYSVVLVEITGSKENSRSSTSKQNDDKATSRKSKRTVSQRQQSTHVVDTKSEHTKKPRTKKNVVSANKGGDVVVRKITTQRVRKGQKVLEGVTVPVHVESSTGGREDKKRTSKKKAVYKPSTKIKKGRCGYIIVELTIFTLTRYDVLILPLNYL